jgi:hypothetical protein
VLLLKSTIACPDKTVRRQVNTRMVRSDVLHLYDHIVSRWDIHYATPEVKPRGHSAGLLKPPPDASFFGSNNVHAMNIHNFNGDLNHFIRSNVITLCIAAYNNDLRWEHSSIWAPSGRVPQENQ